MASRAPSTLSRRAGDTSRKRWAARITVALLIAVLVAVLPARLMNKEDGDALEAFRRELADTEQKVERLRAENARDLRRIEALKNDPAAIEDIARKDLGMVRPGEVVLRIEAKDAPR